MPWTRAVHEAAKSSTQRFLYARLTRPSSLWAEERIRYKLQRWRLPGIPRLVACRVLRRLRALARLVPPRVHVAVFGTIWNRWCTARRFQIVSQARHSCLLGCASGEDSIEHYLRCPLVLEVARCRLNLHCSGSESWLLCLLASEDLAIQRDSVLARIALLVYAAYRTTNAVRHCGTLSREEAKRAMYQAIYEGTAWPSLAFWRLSLSASGLSIRPCPLLRAVVSVGSSWFLAASRICRAQPLTLI